MLFEEFGHVHLIAYSSRMLIYVFACHFILIYFFLVLPFYHIYCKKIEEY